MCPAAALPGARSLAWSLVALFTAAGSVGGEVPTAAARPNFLVIQSDDHGMDPAGRFGHGWVPTPHLDALAAGGVRFAQAYVQAPSCSPSRAALLTGRSPWQLGPGMVLWGEFPHQFMTYPRLLSRHGYQQARFGKGWGPGRDFVGNNPAGGLPRDRHRQESALSDWPHDTPRDFADFLAGLRPDDPFVAWVGFTEPHRPYRPEAWRAAGIDPDAIRPPGYLPDTPAVREDLANYAAELKHLDAQVGRLVEVLRSAGRLDNTVVIYTSDNGMPFPRAKVTCYEAGIRVPLIVSWPGRIPGGRVVTDLVTTTDLMPTLLDYAGVSPPPGITGRSLRPALDSGVSGQHNPEWKEVIAGLERHDFGFHSPERALRSGRFLYVRHYAPAAPKPPGDTSPSHLAVADLEPGHPLYPLYAIRKGRMPAEELFDVEADPECLRDLAPDPVHAETLARLRARLDERLAAEGDPRHRGLGYIFAFFPTFKFNAETDYNYDALPVVNEPSPARR